MRRPRPSPHPGIRGRGAADAGDTGPPPRRASRIRSDRGIRAPRRRRQAPRNRRAKATGRARDAGPPASWTTILSAQAPTRQDRRQKQRRRQGSERSRSSFESLARVSRLLSVVVLTSLEIRIQSHLGVFVVTGNFSEKGLLVDSACIGELFERFEAGEAFSGLAEFSLVERMVIRRSLVDDCECGKVLPSALLPVIFDGAERTSDAVVIGAFVREALSVFVHEDDPSFRVVHDQRREVARFSCARFVEFLLIAWGEPAFRHHVHVGSDAHCHLVAVAGIGRTSPAVPSRGSQIGFHHLLIPVESARGHHHGLLGANTDGLAAFFRYATQDFDGAVVGGTRNEGGARGSPHEFDACAFSGCENAGRQHADARFPSPASGSSERP